MEIKKAPSKLRFIGLSVIFLSLWILNILLPLGTSANIVNYTQRIWLISMISLGLFATYIIMKESTLDKRNLLIASILALFVWSPISSVITFLTYYAGSLLFKKTTNRIKALEGTPASLLRSILLGIVIAIPLGALNVFFALSSNTMNINLQNPLWAAIFALNPGISEEVIFRYFIYAICVYLLRDKLESKGLRVLCITMMVLPHVLLHLPDTFLVNPINGLVSMIMLSLLFGLPMAILQLRRGLEAAIALHWCIDFIRFLTLGK